MATTNDKIKNALNVYTPLLRENFKKTFVTLQGGKGLSTNDFTDNDKNKLSSISSGAQVNTIENIQLDGTNVSISADKTAIIKLADTYAKKSDISSVFKYKGGVEKFDDLPDASLNAVGDVWNISLAGGTDKDGVEISKGDNVAWTADGWDVLAGSVDLSNYVTIESGKGLSSNDFTAAEKMKLANIEVNAQANVIESISIKGGQVEIDDDTKTANITVSGGTASLGTVLTALDKVSSISADQFIYANKDNSFTTADITPFARKLFTASSAAQLRSYWQGFQDIDFDLAGNSWSVYGTPYMSTKNAAFGKALQTPYASGLLCDSTFDLSGNFTIEGFVCFDDLSGTQEIALFQASQTLNLYLANSKFNLHVNGQSFVYSQAPSVNQISYFCLQSDGSTFSFSFDALPFESISSSFGSAPLALAFNPNTANISKYNLHGSLSEVRLSDIVRYSQPTIPSAPFTLDDNTLSLLHFDC